MALQIPESQLQALRTLTGMSDQVFGELSAGLNEVRPMLSARGLAAQIASRVDVPLDELTLVVRSLISMHATKTRLGLPADEMVDLVVRSVAGVGGPSESDIERLRQRLMKVLSIDGALEIVARASDVALENKLIFEDSRVLTDIRPVFSASKAPEPKAALILHTLKLSTHGEEGHATHFFALDGNDVRALKEQLERAILKEDALKLMLERSSLPHLELKFD